MRSSPSKVRLSRALGIPLTPKAARHMDKRPYGPGQHGRTRRRVGLSDYKMRLLEKQRLRAQYDISEAQLRLAVAKATRRPGKTGEALLTDLEIRLDALVHRAGFGRTMSQARQMVSHEHIRVDGRKVDKPSYRVRPGQVIGVAERSKDMVPFRIAATGENAVAPPTYLDVDAPDLTARLTRLPARDEIPVICEEQLVVEFYAR